MTRPCGLPFPWPWYEKNKINKNVDITFIDTFWNNLPSVRSKSKDWNLNFSHISFGRLGAINYKTK